MCGIVFADLIGRSNKRVLKRYQHQSKRGTQGYGCVCIDNGIVTKILRQTTEQEIRRDMKKVDSHTMLFHHRNPTSTPNIDECNHPIYISNKCLDWDYLVVHNGVISNAKTLKDKYEKLGFVYQTEVSKMYKAKVSDKKYFVDTQFNDSESFAIDIALAIEEEKSNIDSVGSIAFIALKIAPETGEVKGVYYGRNGSNPLKLDDSNGELFITSEGRGKDVEPNFLHLYDLNTKRTTKKFLRIGFVQQAITPSVTTPTGTTTATPQLPADRPAGKMMGGNEYFFTPTIEKDRVFISYYKHRTQTMMTKSFQVVNGQLLRTSLDLEQMLKVKDNEWSEYDDINTELEFCLHTIETDKGKDGGKLTDKELKEAQNDIKRLFQKIHEFENTVKTREKEVFRKY